jgi:hypothetical protein
MKQLNGISVLLLFGVSASCEQLEHLRMAVILTKLGHHPYRLATVRYI